MFTHRAVAFVAAALTVGSSVSSFRRTAARARATAFTAHTIDTGLTGGYQVVIADMNGDGKPDVIALASGLHELRWYENPGWQRHVIVSGINAPINAAVFDVDGDGIPEIALAHGFATDYAKSAGIVSILTHRGDPTGPWSMEEIDRLPTAHRLRFVDIDGDGRKALVNFPLIGEHAAAPEYRDHVPLVMYRPGAWKREMISNDDEGVVHGILPISWDGARESLLSASFRGIYDLRYADGHWTRTRLAAGSPSPWPKSGSSDVAAAHVGTTIHLGAIEPWHGNEVVVYRRGNGAWSRRVVDSTIADGHTIIAADIDGGGSDAFIVGERQGKRSVYIYRLADAASDRWEKTVLDPGGMAAAGCAAADLNGDRRTDVVCIGTATANLKWYENSP